MLSFVKGCCISGMSGRIINIETDVTSGIPFFDIVGLARAASKDSKERVRVAIRNSGYIFPNKRLLVNLSPANLRKDGTYFDLPISIGVLIASGQITGPITKKDYLGNFIFLGELSLDGSLKPCIGVLPMVIEAYKSGVNYVVLPLENAKEASIIREVTVVPVVNLKEAVEALKQPEKFVNRVKNIKLEKCSEQSSVDFSDVLGQSYAKRALEIAAAGGHNVLMMGAPGSGKTMLARRIPTILPELTYKEALETSIIHSIAGVLPNENGLLKERPFRSPHNTTTSVSLIGGGQYPKPGEISLAHNGVLFLDEISQFKSECLENLRQPMQEGKITICRHGANVTYPSSFMLIAASNPCKCGKLYERNKECTCTPYQISLYQNKLSGAIMDRIDIKIDVVSTDLSNVEKRSLEETSEEIRNRVTNCREIQRKRYKDENIYTNSFMDQNMVWKYCEVSSDSEDFLKSYCQLNNISARSYVSVLKVARTIADLDNKKNIEKNHIAEALQYRIFNRK